MRPLVRADGITKAFGPAHVLRNAAFHLFEHDKVALVGPNGSGKTTLFRMLAGLLRPDLGEFERAPELRVAYLPQVPDLPPQTPVREVLTAPSAEAQRIEAEVQAIEAWMTDPGAFDSPDASERMTRYSDLQALLAEERSKGNALASPLLNDLAVPDEVMDQKFGELSGGEKSKVLLVKALAAAKDTDLLLLDEPTNHMDIPTVEFIEDYLMGLDAAVVVSAHDQYLLDNVATRVFEVADRRIYEFEGNYTDYLDQREAYNHALEAKRRKNYDEVKHQLQVIEAIKKRNRYASVTHRKKAIEKLRAERLAKPVKNKGFNLLFDTERVPRHVLSARGVSKSFGSRVLFRNVELEIDGGDKVGLIGANGCGKSTLLRLLTGRIAADAGTIDVGGKVSVGYFDQHHETLNPERTLLDEIRSLRQPPPPDDWSRGLLGRFNFSGDTVHKQVGVLSGGERARLSLAKFIANKYNFLVLDEPTNHLDLASQEIVASALRDYEGTVLVVSHDRSFLDRICNKLVVIAHRQVGVFPGNFTTAWTSKQLADFTASGVKGRYRVHKAFRDWERDARYHKGDVIEVTGMETQSFRRLLTWAEAEGRVELMLQG